jgi:hypothetical protein
MRVRNKQQLSRSLIDPAIRRLHIQNLTTLANTKEDIDAVFTTEQEIVKIIVAQYGSKGKRVDQLELCYQYEKLMERCFDVSSKQLSLECRLRSIRLKYMQSIRSVLKSPSTPLTQKELLKKIVRMLFDATEITIPVDRLERFLSSLHQAHETLASVGKQFQ